MLHYIKCMQKAEVIKQNKIVTHMAKTELNDN